MARISAFSEGTQDVMLHPTEVECHHQIIQGQSGEKYLHLTTFGSTARLSRPKSSQSLQLDASAARQLIRILRDAFPDLS